LKGDSEVEGEEDDDDNNEGIKSSGGAGN